MKDKLGLERIRKIRKPSSFSIYIKKPNNPILYPQYYAAKKLYENIKNHRLPNGDGKGGTYFGATGCGKSFTMLFLTRLLMKSVDFSSPTIVLITDRTDLDDQLARDFTNAKGYIGDDNIISVESRADLRTFLKGRDSGGVFLTTIHKFTEDTELLTDRNNVICISDEAHRSQINLDQKIVVTEEGVRRTYGFAKYLHDSLPNATFVGFTGTPIDATLAKPTVKQRSKKGYWPGRILQVRGELAASITSKYDENSAVVGTNKAYAAIHQFGGDAGRNKKVKITARLYLYLTEDDKIQVLNKVREYLIN